MKTASTAQHSASLPLQKPSGNPGAVNKQPAVQFHGIIGSFQARKPKDSVFALKSANTKLNSNSDLLYL